jgi:hypothetical protein
LRERLVYGEGDSSTGRETHPRRGRLVYKGEDSSTKKKLACMKTRDRGQDMEEQRTGNRGEKDRNSGIEPQKRLIDRVLRTGDNEQSYETGDGGRETRNRDIRHGT